MTNDTTTPGASTPRLSAEQRTWIERHHTTGNLTRATDGHLLCDEEDLPWPCPTMAALNEIDALSAEQAVAEREAADYWQIQTLELLTTERDRATRAEQALAEARATIGRLHATGRSLLPYLHHGSMAAPFCDSMASLPHPDCDCGLRGKAAIFVDDLAAAATPAAPAEPAPTHPWFLWLTPTGSVSQRCCDRPQSAHPSGHIAWTLDDAEPAPDEGARGHVFVPLSGSNYGDGYTRCGLDGCDLAPDQHEHPADAGEGT